MQMYLAVFIGGGLGSLCRYALSRWPGHLAGGFPLGTLIANVLACLVLGLAVQYFAQRIDLSPALKAMVLVGFCGGFSTFSTFSLETFRLMEAGQWGLVAAYVLTSVLSCLAVLWLVAHWGR
jgi:fluoride exporter